MSVPFSSTAWCRWCFSTCFSTTSTAVCFVWRCHVPVHGRCVCISAAIVVHGGNRCAGSVRRVDHCIWQVAAAATGVRRWLPVVLVPASAMQTHPCGLCLGTENPFFWGNCTGVCLVQAALHQQQQQRVLLDYKLLPGRVLHVVGP